MAKNIPTRQPNLRKPEQGNVPVQKGGTRSKGVTNDALKQLGRNLARVANQKG